MPSAAEAWRGLRQRLRPLRRRWRRWTYRAARWRYVQARRTTNPVVVYTLGKTGSSAVIDAIERSTGDPVLQVHYLAALAEVEALVRRYGPDRRSREVWNAHLLRAMPATAQRPWRVVSLIRDPVALDISAFFQTGEHFGHLSGTTPASDIARLRRVWETEHDHDFPARWFDDELKATLGIDVLATPFDIEQGWMLVEEPHARVLVLRTESLDRAVAGLTALLGGAPPTIARVHESRDKPYGPLYEQFLDGYSVPSHLLDRAYSSPVARHFYSPEELARFRARWEG